MHSDDIKQDPKNEVHSNVEPKVNLKQDDQIPNMDAFMAKVQDIRENPRDGINPIINLLIQQKPSKEIDEKK